MCIHLVIDGEEIDKSASYKDYGRLDFSRVWQNTLDKEMGNCKVFDISHIRSQERNSLPEEKDNPDSKLDYAGIFKKAAAVIFTSSVKNPPDDLISEACRFIKDGNLIVIEMPSPRWNGLMEREVVPRDVETSNISLDSGINRISPRILPLSTSDHLTHMPLTTRIMDIDSVPDDMEVLFRIAKKPAFVQYELDAGWIIFLFFDFGMQMTSICQGTPSKRDYSVKKHLSHIPLIKESEDLAIHENMLKKLHPYADILAKFFFAALEDLISFPRLWYYPYKHDGVFMMTHDDEKRGQSISMYMVEEEFSRKFTSTFFVICSPGVEKRWENADKDVIDKGFDIQWHWNRFPDNLQIYSPEEQIENFNKIPGVNLTSCRIHFLNWGNHYTKPFRVMEKQGVSFDSTYGPNKGRGYLFGTGMPFHPIDTDGSLFSLYEVPFQTQEDWAGVDIKYFEKLFKNSLDLYHSIIISIFHPHKVAKGKGRDLWLGSFELAKKYNHWITTFSEFGDFYKKRCKVEMKRSEDGERRTDAGGRICRRDVPVPINEERKSEIKPGDPPFRIITDAGRKYMLIPASKFRSFDIPFLKNLNFSNIPEEMEDVIAVRIPFKFSPQMG
ncbi:MAG: hypothetical protein K8T10_19515 [Candidatus Eremiobacteraeota bacterium]|nr:hypothetical protein [Candidatus Eremiobacteraeota bacterium]